MIERCPWAEADELARVYHDTRWCKPCHDDAELFALLVLEGQQAGLSWSLILKREAGIREACDGLDPAVCAAYGEAKEAELLQHPAMIRNRLKVRSVGKNARAFLRVAEEFGSFDAYIWGFTDGQVIDHHLARQEDMPATSELSECVSRDLKRRGFTFVGPTIVYSYLQAVGVINDHVEGCPFR